MITSVGDFFFKSFQEYLLTTNGSIPFQNNSGTTLKESIQTKNTVFKQMIVDNEINGFINDFNKYYGEVINVREIVIENNESQDGGDTWAINVNAIIEESAIQFKIINKN